MGSRYEGGGFGGGGGGGLMLRDNVSQTPFLARRPSVRPFVVVLRRPSVNFHIFDFSSETAEQNSTKLDRKQDLNALYQVCVFSGWSEKQDGRPGLW